MMTWAAIPAAGSTLAIRGALAQVVEYGDVQFTKAPGVLKGIGLEGLRKRPDALRRLLEKGLD